MTPEQLRAVYSSEASANPAVAEFRAFLTSGKRAEDDYYAWLSSPMTQRVVRALEEIADNPPVSSNQDALIQYGMTSGLQMAVKLITQPKRLYPEVFQDAKPKKDGPLDKAYTVTADDVIDKM